MKREPDVWTNLQAELADAARWRDRVVVAAAAVAAGLAVVGFSALADAAFDLYLAGQQRWWWLPLVATPLTAALVVWAMRRWFPMAAGSGVPQVEAALLPGMDAAAQTRLVSWQLSLAKALSVTAGMLGGLSIGRQGPSVQIAAGVMLLAQRGLSANSRIGPRDLLVAGGAAGIAAAFNTPLGGVVFAIEELSRRLEYKISGLTLAAIVAAGLVAVAILGPGTVFGQVAPQSLSGSGWLAGALVALVSGALGGLLARLLLASFTGVPDRFCAWRRKWPVAFAAGCGLVVGMIGVVTGGMAVGGGHHHTHALLDNVATTVPGLWTGLKFVASWLSAWAGVPGGIFGPSLSIGAGIGRDVADLLAMPDRAALIALGMAGFLAAVTQTPVTAMIIVMEMTDGHSMVLSLMACALVASAVSRLVSRPLYPAMADVLARRVSR